MNFLEDQKVITLSEVCRVCLVKTQNMKNLLEPNEETIQIIMQLSSLLNVEIEINDTTPCSLCDNCEEKLKISYDFQQLCQKSQSFILTCLSDSVNFKVNPCKPLDLVDSIEKTATESVDNNKGFISYVGNDGLTKKIEIVYYAYDVTDSGLPSNGEGFKENQKNVPENCAELINDSNEIKIETEDNGNQTQSGPVKTDGNENQTQSRPVETEDDENQTQSKPVETEDNKNQTQSRPVEIGKKTRHKQTMRLSQFSQEDVRRIISKFRERFSKHVDCQHCGFTAKDPRALSVHMTRLHKVLKENWCFICNNNFDNLSQHIKVDHTSDFTCPLCGKYSINTGHLMEHLACHSSERRYICKLCDKCFVSKRHLDLHTAVHTKGFQCHVCSEMFGKRKLLINHVKTHEIQKCESCQEQFSSPEGEKAHVCCKVERKEDIANDTVESFVESRPQKKGVPNNFCKICNIRVRSLATHLQKKHSTSEAREIEKKALCLYCGKLFRSISRLTVHERVHTKETPYKCSYCGKGTVTRARLVSHERTHTGEKPYICKVCGKGFAQSSVLNTHMRLHTGRPHKCTFCHKKFCRLSELRQHMRKHTGEKPFECNICGEEFAQQSHLVCHKRTHYDERPFKCDYCEMSFKQQSSLRSHTNIHLGLKPYKCPDCNYASRQSYSVKIHMRQHEKVRNSDKFHRCKICNQNFVCFEIYSLHYKKEHEGLEKHDIIKENLVAAAAEEVVDHFEELT